MTRVFIIEDEIKTARYLANMVGEAEGFIVAGMSGSVKGALAWLAENQVELILSDIQLADGLSFEIFRQQPATCPVIFCTAFDQYAINAFEANGIDYLLKPIDPEKLQLSLKKFRNMQQLFAPKGDYVGRLDSALQGIMPKHKTTLLVHHRERIIPLKLDDVQYAHSENGILMLYTLQMRYHVNHTLEELETMLDPQRFFRINRQLIVNKEAIEGAEHYFSRRLLLRMKVSPGSEVVVSKARVQAFLAWLKT